MWSNATTADVVQCNQSRCGPIWPQRCGPMRPQPMWSNVTTADMVHVTTADVVQCDHCRFSTVWPQPMRSNMTTADVVQCDQSQCGPMWPQPMWSSANRYFLHKHWAVVSDDFRVGLTTSVLWRAWETVESKLTSPISATAGKSLQLQHRRLFRPFSQAFL